MRRGPAVAGRGAARRNGWVIGVTRRPLVNRGDAMIHAAYPEDREAWPLVALRAPDRAPSRVASAGAMGMTGFNDEPPPEHGAPDVHLEIGGPPRQPLRDEQVDPLELVPLVAAEVLALCVGVDRHLRQLASANGGDEVDGDRPASLAGQVQRGVCDVHLHGPSMTHWQSSRSIRFRGAAASFRICVFRRHLRSRPF